MAHGEVGEIAIRSAFLASGYWRNPTLTQARFLPDPADSQKQIYLTGDLGRWREDGLLEHLGRADQMVKIRGNRVEIGAVEAALLALPAISAAAVVAMDGASNVKRLVAYLMPAVNERPTTVELRNHLHASLPDYMIPTRYVWIEKMPLLPSGKIDRTLLAPPGAARPDLSTPFVAPRNELEKQIAAIWAELLEYDEIGVDDNFFELGGDSILALRMAIAVEQRLGQQVPPIFFHTPTIGELSHLLQPNPALPTTGATAESSTYKRQFSRTPSPLPAPRPVPRRSLWQRFTRHALLRRLRRPVEDAIFAQAPDLVRRRLAQWCAAAARLGLYAPELALLNAMQLALGHERVASPEQRNAYLMGNLLMQQWWRLPRPCRTSEPSDVLQAAIQPFWRDIWRLIQHGSPNELAVQFSFAGWEELAHAHQHGRGVILLSYHSPGLTFITQVISRRLGCEPILTNVQYGGLQATKRGIQQARFIASELVAATAERTQRAYQQLCRGGIVHFANDHGYTLDKTVACQVAGRQYHFKAGFAEMAQSTGAAIVPMFALCAPSGHIHGVFRSPFSTCASDTDRDRFTRNMLDQYADFLQRGWCAHPASLQWGVIERHLLQPFVAPRG